MKPSLRFVFSAAAAALYLTGCATRPPRQPGPPQTPVMPPPQTDIQGPKGRGGGNGLPPPVEITLDRPVEESAALTPPPVVRDTPMPRPAPQPRQGTPYTIRQGESLSSIAARNRMSWVKLAQYNRIAEPYKVRAGQVILIPGTAGASAPSSMSPRVAPPPPSANSGSTHVVQSGENLTVIARRYNTTVSDLKSANSLRSDRLLVGQILKLPGASYAPRPPRDVAPVPTPAPPPAPTPVPVAETVETTTPVVEETAAATTAEVDPMVDKPFTIVVMEGDTLETIAANYVVSVEKIRELNDLPADAVLQPGQKLEMPPGLY